MILQEYTWGLIRYLEALEARVAELEDKRTWENNLIQLVQTS